jgi:uncharacterized protein (DUF2235 family)
MPRNFVICCDGTNNQFGPQNTSVVRLIQVLDRDPSKQRLYYDPGVGTLPEPSVFTAVGKRISELVGLAFGGGLTWKVEEAYSYLMDYWEPGDRVFVFGFSRGAYAARVLAGLLHELGLLPRGNQNLVPYVMRLFSSIRNSKAGEGGRKSEYWELCDQFRWTFARPMFEGDNERRFRVHFLGVWDTVSSVGWLWDPAKFPFTARNPSIDIVRHAVSVDERRWFFRQNLAHQAEGQDLKELWFAGVHSDVGGGYPEKDGGLWRAPFEWMLGEAEQAGLLVDPQRLQIVLNRAAPSTRPWMDQQHESLTPLWWPAEFFPKLQWRPKSRDRFPAIGMGRHRRVDDNALIHKSTLLRIREAQYAPPNLSERFLETVRALAVVPESLPFKR